MRGQEATSHNPLATYIETPWIAVIVNGALLCVGSVLVVTYDYRILECMINGTIGLFFNPIMLICPLNNLIGVFAIIPVVSLFALPNFCHLSVVTSFWIGTLVNTTLLALILKWFRSL